MTSPLLRVAPDKPRACDVRICLHISPDLPTCIHQQALRIYRTLHWYNSLHRRGIINPLSIAYVFRPGLRSG